MHFKFVNGGLLLNMYIHRAHRTYRLDRQKRLTSDLGRDLKERKVNNAQYVKINDLAVNSAVWIIFVTYWLN